MADRNAEKEGNLAGPVPGINRLPLREWQQAIWLLLALVAPLFVNFWVEQPFEASKVWLWRFLVWVAAVLWLGGWLVGPRPSPLPPHIRFLLTLLLIILALSTAFSPTPYIAFFGTLDRAHGALTQASYLLLFWCVATQIDPAQSRQLLSVIVLTAVPICVLGLIQATGWQPLPVLTDARSPLTTTLGRANFTGAYLALLLPLTLTAAYASRIAWRRLGYGALLGLEIWVIALTQARAAWIAAIVGISALGWLQLAPRWTRRRQRLSAGGGILLLAAGLWLVWQWGLARGGSIAARWTIWQASLRLLWPRLWLGYGADTLDLHFPSNYPPQLVYYQGRGVVVDRAHNWLLDWSLNYGVVATVLFAALVYLLWRQGQRRLAHQAGGMDPPPGEPVLARHWLAAAMAGICAHLAGNLFLFDVSATALAFWLLMGIVSAATSDRQAGAAPGLLPLQVRRGMMAAGVLILAWAVWQGSVRPLLADSHALRGTRALRQGNAAGALAEYAAAVSYQPQRAPYHVGVALAAAELGRFAQAEEAMQAALALRPTDHVLYTRLAAVYARQAIATATPEKIELAYGSFQRAIALAPTIALTHQQFADLALRLGDTMEALRQAQRAVDLDATDGVSFGIMGWAHLQAGDLAAAENAFAQAVRWQPDSADFHLGQATVYYRQGRFDAARQSVQRSLSRDPAYAPALTLRSILPDN